MLLYTLLAHIIIDFITQSDSVVRKRISKDYLERLKYNFKHALTYGIALLPILVIFRNVKCMLLYITISIIIHFIIDSIKSEILVHNGSKYELIIFIVDQLMHFISIVVIWSQFNYIFYEYIDNISEYIINNSNIRELLNYYGIFNIYSYISNLILFLIISGYVCLAGGICIEKLFKRLNFGNEPANHINNEQASVIQNQRVNEEIAVESVASNKVIKEKIEENAECIGKNKKGVTEVVKSISKQLNDKSIEEKEIIVKTIEGNECIDNIKKIADCNGFIIGVAERLIIFILAVNMQFTSIAFVLTAKSIVRNSKVTDDKAFGEKYLIGTLISILISILGAIIFNVFRFI